MRRKNLIKNILFTLFYQIIAIISGFIIPKAIIQSYGSSVNGLVSSIGQFLAYIYIAEGGVGVIIKFLLYKPIAENDKNKIEKIMKSAQKFLFQILIIFIIYVIFLCVFYPKIVSNSFETYFTITLIIVIAINRFSEYFMAMEYDLYLQAKQQNYILSSAGTISIILNTILTIILIKLKCEIITVKAVSACVFIARGLFIKAYVKSKYKINLSKEIEKYEIKQKRDAFAQQIAYIIDTNIDVVLITCFLGTKEVSVYTVYMLVIKGLKSIVSAIMGGVDSSFGDMFARKEYENASKKFSIYQFIYLNIITFLYNLCILLIIPFVQIYTKGITDANYYRPVFAVIITLAEFIYAIKLPYDLLINSAGHFKQTKKFAYIEAFINVVLSLLLINKLGLIGVAIGTVIAMMFKACSVIYYFSVKVLKRNIKIDLKFLLNVLIQTLIILLMGICISKNSIITNYIDWVILAIKIGVIALIIEFFVSWILYKELIQQIIRKIRNQD